MQVDLCNCHKMVVLLQDVTKEVSPKVFWQYFPNDWQFLNKILHASGMFITMLERSILHHREILQFVDFQDESCPSC